MTYLLLLLLPLLASAQLITFMDYSTCAIPHAADLGAPGNLLCFTGWTLIQSADSLLVACNDSISDIVWQLNAPGSLQTNDVPPPATFNLSVPYSPAGVWYVFGDCTFEIIQCNDTRHHNYSEIEDPDPVDCPNGVIATYYVCTNAAIVNVNLRDAIGSAFTPGNPDFALYIGPLAPPPPPVPANDTLAIDVYLHNNAFDVAAAVVGFIADIAILPMIAAIMIVLFYLVWAFVLRKPKYDGRFTSDDPNVVL